jgi:DNA modification methylase
MPESQTLEIISPHYDYENGKLYCGSAIEVLQQMSAESVDCVITSPPYFKLRSYTDDEREIGKETNPYDFVQSLVEVFREVRRVLKKDGTVWLNLGDTYLNSGAGNKKPSGFQQKSQSATEGNLSQYSPKRQYLKAEGLKTKDLIGIPWRVAFALQEEGWWLRQDIIWHKPNPMPESVRDRCTKAHEYIFLLTKSKKYFYDNEAIKEPVKQDWGTRNRKNGKYHKEGSGLQPHSGLEKSYLKKNKRSVWSVAPKPFKGAHFATFPPKLIEPCILAGCREGGVVLDPFVGSGTTCVVAQEHGRHFIGIDLNSEYLEIAHNRIEGAKNNNG